MEQEDKDVEKPESRLLRFISSNGLITATTVCVPVLYLLGYFYHIGFLDKFGVSTEFFPQSVQQYLVVSFFFVFSIAMKVLGFIGANPWLVGVYVAVVFGIVLGGRYFYRHPLNLRFLPKRQFYKSTWLRCYLFQPFKSTCYALIPPYLVLLVLTIFVVFPALGLWIGGGSAEKQISSFNNCELSSLSNKKKCVFLFEDKGSLAAGLLIAKSETHIAIWNGEFTEIFPTDGLRYEVRFGTKPDEED